MLFMIKKAGRISFSKVAYNVEHIRRQGLELLNFQLRTDDK
jgi:hypothetical protein